MIDASLSAHKEITFEQKRRRPLHPPGVAPRRPPLRLTFDENVTQVAPFR